jgi:hypothetical protein
MDTTIPKPFVFILMPFSEDFKDVYELGIKATCKEADTYCERVDEQIYDERITERIYNQIAKADIIVADMTGKNPNVFYETGYAHALGKRVILITKKGEDIPFDLKDYPHIIYKNLTELKTELEKRIRWYVQNPMGSIAKAEFNLEFLINGTRIEGNPLVEYRFIDQYDRKQLQIPLDIHNENHRDIQFSIDIGLRTPLEFNQNNMDNAQVIKLPNGNFIHLIKELDDIFPGAWATYDFDIGTRSQTIHESEFSFTIIAYTQLGLKEFPFRIFVPKSEFEF